HAKLRLGWTEIAGGLLVAWHSLVALVWLGEANDRQTLNALWLVIGYGLTMLMLRQFIDTAAKARTAILVMIWLATTLAAFAYVQYFAIMPVVRAQYERDPEKFLIEQGISSNPNSPQRQLFVNRLQSVEPLATFALTNSLAGFLAPWLMVTLAIGLAAAGDKSGRRELVAAICIAAALAGCLLLTKSRTAVLASLAGVVLLAIYGTRRGALGRWIGWKLPLLAAAALVVIGLAVVYVGGLDVEVLSEAPKSVLYRLEYWRSTAAMIADHPLWGCGPGNFQEAYARYKLPQASEMVRDPHNFLLEVWATTGTPGIVLLLLTALAFVADLTRLQSADIAAATAEPAIAGEKDTAPRTLFFSGCIGGLVVGAALAWLSGYPLDVAADTLVPVLWLLGLPLAVLAWWLLGHWVRQGELPVGAVIVAIVVLMINLLAAGAVIFPGVMLTLLVLIPAAIALRQHSPNSSDSGARQDRSVNRLPIIFPLSRFSAVGLAAGAFALAAGCLKTEYEPVLLARPSQLLAEQRLQQGQASEALEAAQTAAGDDPWTPEPWRIIATARLGRFLADPSESCWAEFLAAANEFQRRNPRHHLQWFERGKWHQLAWQRTGSPPRLEETLAAYRQAISRFPNHALYHAQLAWALNVAGQRAAARKEADRAQALDDSMPHAEQKLRVQQIVDGHETAAGFNTLRSETAEQTVAQLRTPSGRQSVP
ncbi:MAG TPA: O-antigen ligase family protein, partial [Pirellulaceae bacterium]|nr:O-antigen ligase family protein [Pirellulaceae bacterium]